MDRGAWKAAVHGITEGRTRLSNFTFTFHFDALEEEMATHSSILAWRIPGMGKPGGLPSMGSHRVRHDWSDLAAAAVAEALGVCRTWGRGNYQWEGLLIEIYLSDILSWEYWKHVPPKKSFICCSFFIISTCIALHLWETMLKVENKIEYVDGRPNSGK